jgi:hypothetical protein
MGNRHVHEIECLQTLGTSESGCQKVTALNLFYPTASPPSAKGRLFGIATQPLSAGLPGNDLLFYCAPPCLPAGRDPAHPARAGRGTLRSPSKT